MVCVGGGGGGGGGGGSFPLPSPSPFSPDLQASPPRGMGRPADLGRRERGRGGQAPVWCTGLCMSIPQNCVAAAAAFLAPFFIFPVFSPPRLGSPVLLFLLPEYAQSTPQPRLNLYFPICFCFWNHYFEGGNYGLFPTIQFSVKNTKKWWGGTLSAMFRRRYKIARV